MTWQVGSDKIQEGRVKSFKLLERPALEGPEGEDAMAESRARLVGAFSRLWQPLAA